MSPFNGIFFHFFFRWNRVGNDERKARNKKMTLDLNLHLPHEHHNYVLSNILYFKSRHATDLTLFVLFIYLFILYYYLWNVQLLAVKDKRAACPFLSDLILLSPLLLLSHYFHLGPPRSPFSQSLLSAPVWKFAYLYSWKEGAREGERIMTAISSLSQLAGLRESVV